MLPLRTIAAAACLSALCEAAFPVYTTSLSKDELRFTLAHTQQHAENTFSDTYLSPPMPLRPGEVVFTDPSKTFLSMPKGDIAITKFEAEVGCFSS